MKTIKCNRDGLPCDLNRGAKSCRNGPWAGQCFDRIEVEVKRPRPVKKADEVIPEDRFAPEEADGMAAQEAEDLAREQAEQDAHVAYLAAQGPEGGDL